MKRESIYSIGLPAEKAHMPFIDFVMKYARKGDIILDLGGGAGAYSAELNKRGNRCVNVDLNRDYIKSSLSSGNESCVMNAAHLAFKDKSFDIVILFESLEHISDYEKVLMEAKRVAKRYILITVPNCTGFKKLKTSGLTYDHFLATDHLNFFTKIELEQILKKHFERVTVLEVQPIQFELMVPSHLYQSSVYILKKLKIIKPDIYYRLYSIVEV